MQDPRPYLGEPLALDLLNTRWMEADGPRDLLDGGNGTDGLTGQTGLTGLAGLAGLGCWLATNRLTDRCAADEPTRAATVAARDAIHRVLTGGDREALNAVLDRGRIRRSLTGDGPADTAEVAQPQWLAGWLAADNLLRLLDSAPHRIKQCGHPQCVLWFYDTSKNASRRWHSMSACGNRLKAARHYAAKTDRQR